MLFDGWFTKKNSNKFLEEFEKGVINPDCKVSVNALELRDLILAKRKLEKYNEKLKYKVELLELRNISLKQEVIKETANNCEKILVTNLDLKV